MFERVLYLYAIVAGYCSSIIYELWAYYMTHPIVALLTMLLGGIMMYHVYVGWMSGMVIPIWARVHPIPYTLQQLYNELCVDCCNLKIVANGVFRTLYYPFIGIGIAIVVFLIGFIVILSITLFNPTFWVILASIKILFM